MQKKLLAVAVLSAFSGLAAAQSANVTLYGTFNQNVEQASATGGDSSPTAGTSSFRGGANGLARVAAPGVGIAGVADQSNRMRFNPAGSNFGIRGTEDLGNGLSAWFQAELAMQVGNSPPNAGTNHGTAASYRNTAVGLRSNTWGTVLFGMWDSPFNAMHGQFNISQRTVGASTSNAANLMGGNVFAQGAVSGQSTAAWCTPVAAGGGATAANCANFGMNFDRRERSSIQYWSPNWNGFEVRGSYTLTADNGGITVNNLASGLNTLKQDNWDINGQYTNGGLRVGYGYAKQRDQAAAAVRTWNAAGGAAFAAGEGVGGWTTGANAAVGDSFASGSTGVGHRLGATYKIGSSGFAVGALWESLKWDMSYGVRAGAVAAASQNLSQLKKTAYRLQGNYTTGNHFVGVEYTRANAMTGSIVSATAAAANTFDGSSTGARNWVLSYNYMLSKRTSLGAYYNTVRNETNANYSGIVFGGIATAPGASPRYIGMNVKHSF